MHDVYVLLLGLVFFASELTLSASNAYVRSSAPSTPSPPLHGHAFGCVQDTRATNTMCMLPVYDTHFSMGYHPNLGQTLYFSCEAGCVLLNFQYKY